ncbi:hypothetical protein [Clostridium massiliamazoniense]|uniref:hypothetical protein n=1 Tax=Clostridium massiliamazoniense TaxID=1347366 RepID=UPI0006D861E9|nr:hypothetical protein [Clostridium massiliamazoniense]
MGEIEKLKENFTTLELINIETEALAKASFIAQTQEIFDYFALLFYKKLMQEALLRKCKK